MNSLMRRRRALAAKGKADTTIYGSKLEWKQGYIDSSTGVIDQSYSSWISTVDFIPMTPGKVLTYTGPDKENGVEYRLYAYCYDSNFNFLERVYIYLVSSHYVSAQIINSSTAYIKLSYGHSSSGGIDVLPSAGSLMVCAGQDRSEVKNGFVDGSYTHGTTSFSIENNVFSMLSIIKNGTANSFNPRFKYPLNIKTGDTIRVKLTKTAGSMSGAYVLAFSVGGNSIGNVTWDASTGFNVTVTSSTSNNTLFIDGSRSTGQDRTFTNYKCTIAIFVNGTQVLPEV